MDLGEIIVAVIGAIAVVTTTVIQTSNLRYRKRTEERAARRERESRLSMELMSATMDLAYVTSLAVTGGHTNGNVKAAQGKADKAKEAYEAFLRDETAHSVSKI